MTGLLLRLITVLGVAIASHHLYIKMNPELVSCGMDVEKLLALFPLREGISQMLIGSSDCAVAADLLWHPLIMLEYYRLCQPSCGFYLLAERAFERELKLACWIYLR